MGLHVHRETCENLFACSFLVERNDLALTMVRANLQVCVFKNASAFFDDAVLTRTAKYGYI